ncbi:MAG: hypothetical protein HKN36_12585 [Hellea sp.]|nr:hypothetical protein [Hellea sp.]
MTDQLAFDHKVLDSARATRRYFAKFERIISHMGDVAALSYKEKYLSPLEARITLQYLQGLAHTFTALSYKFLMANRVGDHSAQLLSIDKSDSGFPVYREILQMAADALQADDHLLTLPTQSRIKKDMISHILSKQTHPTQLQYALSQRIYYEHLSGANLFLSQNHPQAQWEGNIKKKKKKNKKKQYLIHWSSYDSQTNVPTIYLLDLEDTGKKALPLDERRWPRVQSHLLSQSMSGLKLITIARGFDQDFDGLHPKRLRRIHLGPMYSHAFTEQHGPLREVLAEASGKPGLDWALAWTIETLTSENTKRAKTGFFNTAQREVFKLDPSATTSLDDGATEVQRALILPHRAYQVLREKAPPSLARTRKYVVGKDSKILSYL